ncbi:MULTISPECIES: hypothetical protein [unclassified Brevibacillus]|uniref:hypothetical protein n=1 Tax=unclassified Brevibacillus TaxID=2684853 RepID=UPI003566E64D
MNLIDIQIKYNEVLKKKLTIEDFEQWVYVTPEIEERLLSGAYQLRFQGEIY